MKVFIVFILLGIVVGTFCEFDSFDEYCIQAEERQNLTEVKSLEYRQDEEEQLNYDEYSVMKIFHNSVRVCLYLAHKLESIHNKTLGKMTSACMRSISGCGTPKDCVDDAVTTIDACPNADLALNTQADVSDFFKCFIAYIRNYVRCVYQPTE